MRPLNRLVSQVRVLAPCWSSFTHMQYLTTSSIIRHLISRGLTSGGLTENLKRNWDSSCPRVWDSWTSNDVKWVIRDLRPEDDEEALKILMEHMAVDETLCVASNLLSDPVSARSIKDFWRNYLTHRMSLALYEEKQGESKLVGLNAFLVIKEGDEPNDVIEGEPWKNVYGALKVCDDRLDTFKFLGVDKILYGVGIVIRRDYRGKQLGSKILAARENLARHLGIVGTSAVFTGPASQISAERTGFTTALTVTLKDLTDAGLKYPKDEKRSIKVMVKKYE